MDRAAVENARQQAEGGHRTQKTFYLTDEITRRVNAAKYWALPMALARAEKTGEQVDIDAMPDSASALVETALWAEVLYLEEQLNDGKPFPPAPGKLSPGPGQKGKERMSGARKSKAPSKGVGANPSGDSSAD